GAETRSGITCPSDMTLVRGGANHRVRARADTRQAGVGLRTSITVVAGSTIKLRGVGAETRGGITRSGDVTLIGGGADYRVTSCAYPTLAGVGLRAGVAVVAGIRVRRVDAAGRGIAAVVGAPVGVVASRGRNGDAIADATSVVGGADGGVDL